MTPTRALVWILATLALSGCASRQGASAPARSSIVTVVLESADGKSDGRAAAVLENGHVLVRLSREMVETDLWVITSDGVRHSTNGLSDFRFDDDNCVGLVEVDWQGPVPPGIPVAGAPPVGTEVTFPAPGHTAQGKRVSAEPVTSPVTDPLDHHNQFGCAGRSELNRDRTMVVLDARGLVLGVPQAFALSAYIDIEKITAPRFSIEITRPEIVAALKPGQLVPWAQWSSTTQRACKESLVAAKKARILAKQGGSAGASLAALESVRLNDRNAAGWLLVGFFAFQEQEYRAALEAFDRAMSLAPFNEINIAWRASSLARVGRMEEALAESERALAMNPSSAENQGLRAFVLLMAGHREEAIAGFKEALRLDPRDAYASRMLARLEGSSRRRYDRTTLKMPTMDLSFDAQDGADGTLKMPTMDFRLDDEANKKPGHPPSR